MPRAQRILPQLKSCRTMKEETMFQLAQAPAGAWKEKSGDHKSISYFNLPPPATHYPPTANRPMAHQQRRKERGRGRAPPSAGRPKRNQDPIRSKPITSDQQSGSHITRQSPASGGNKSGRCGCREKASQASASPPSSHTDEREAEGGRETRTQKHKTPQKSTEHKHAHNKPN